jgi:hypothetical protein
VKGRAPRDAKAFAAGPWESVKELLPPEGVEVLVCLRVWSELRIGVTVRDGSGWYAERAIGGAVVTHWAGLVVPEGA